MNFPSEIQPMTDTKFTNSVIQSNEPSSVQKQPVGSGLSVEYRPLSSVKKNQSTLDDDDEMKRLQ